MHTRLVWSSGRNLSDRIFTLASPPPLHSGLLQVRRAAGVLGEAAGSPFRNLSLPPGPLFLLLRVVQLSGTTRDRLGASAPPTCNPPATLHDYPDLQNPPYPKTAPNAEATRWRTPSSASSSPSSSQATTVMFFRGLSVRVPPGRTFFQRWGSTLLPRALRGILTWRFVGPTLDMEGNVCGSSWFPGRGMGLKVVRARR